MARILLVQLFFQSAVLSISNSSEQLYTFATDIDLVGGNQYMALLDTSSIGNSVAPFGRLTRIPNTTYLGGEFLWERTSGDGNWDDGFDVDVRFIARFSEPTVVPIPSAVWLLGSGLLGLIGIARRKKA